MDNAVGSRVKISVLHLNNIELAFIAGFLEGDGCISAKISPTSGSYRVLITISFTQRSEGRVVLQYLEKLLGEKVADYALHNMSELMIRDRKKAKSFLLGVSPFLVSKKKQAEIALKIIAILDQSRRGELRSPTNLLKAVRLAEEIRSLNSGRRNKTVHTLETVSAKLIKRGFALTP